VDFEFRNRVLQTVIGVVFNDAMQRIVRAFERRAAQLYGPSVRASSPKA
jgi:coenzyme Q-binding protein COQ10